MTNTACILKRLTIAYFAISGFVSGTATSVVAQTATNTFNVTADVAADCTVTANDLGFGSYGAFNSDLEATTNIDVNCSSGTAYEVGLDGGSTNNNVNDRRMKGQATWELKYQLYSDAARTANWEDVGSGNTVTGTGDGTTQILTIYGRVPSGQDLQANTYTDTVTATVSF